MNEEEFGTQAIRPLLDNSAARVGPSVHAHLREARERALLRYESRGSEPAFAWAGGLVNLRGSGNSHPNRYLYWLAAMLFAISLATSFYWKHMTDQDVSDVDIAILTDDLPIEMYVD